MKEILPPWRAPEELLGRLAREKRLQLRTQTGLPYLALRFSLLGYSTLFVGEEGRAENFADDARALQELLGLPEEWSIGNLPSGSLKERSALLEEAGQKKGLIFSASPESFAEKVPSRRDFNAGRFQLKVGKNPGHASLIRHLSEHGYARTHFVETAGEFAVRGEVLDVWPPNLAEPLRLLFADDVIESMHCFEIDSQRATRFLPEAVLIPIAEQSTTLLQRGSAPSLNVTGKGPTDATLLDHLPAKSVLITEGALTGAEKFPVIELSLNGVDLGITRPAPVHSNWPLLKTILSENQSRSLRSFFLCHNAGEAHRFEEILDGLGLEDSLRPQVSVAAVNDGFESTELGICVYSFSDLTGAGFPRRRAPKFKGGLAFDALTEIQAGDYVVHETFGIGRYRGLERVGVKPSGKAPRGALKTKESEFLVLEYRGGDRLLVPTQDFRLIQKYVGAEGKKPRLFSLDGAAWERVKQKVKREVAEMAKELLQTAALRASFSRGVPAGSDRGGISQNLMQEFADSFPFEETADQAKAIAEILRDMDSPRLMDRLVCGDVGYGKTEIAMRAAFKAISESRQVAVLVPTTILAEQHLKTFRDRFAAFPVRVEMLSRFQKAADNKRVLSDLAAGQVDIVIGTHRLLQNDVRMKNPGLVIIDEEHRFGVGQKEKMKRFRHNVDLLSLSATPIPRTLSMAMGGVRAISLVETPPEGRQPIETHLGAFDEELLKEAVRRERLRGGQIFYVHNRIATIETRKRMLQKLFPELRIGLAHGQMDGKTLEEAMWNFLHGKWDLLLSTSIIESGLDIPNVNTLIVEDTEEFGLAQLYQLRGRVGRQRQKACCILFFSDWAHLSEDARKRLAAIQEYSALGSGMKLAMRDLEIRGTGNLLGPQQHGWISAVGLDLYCRMLAEQIRRLKDEGGAPEAEEKPLEIPPVEIELNLSAYIPDDYVESQGERIRLYKKIAACPSEEEAAALAAELADRFGPLPQAVRSLLEIVRLKGEALQAGVVSITETGEGLLFGWRKAGEEWPLDVVRLATENASAVEILPPAKAEEKAAALEILFKEEGAGDVFARARKFLQISRRYVKIGEHFR